MKKILMAASVCLLLQACAPQIQSHVTKFHDNFETNKSFVVLPTDKQENNLEYKQIAASVAAQLEQHGLTPRPESKADYAAFVSYGIDDGKMVTGAVPIMGQTGGGTTYHSGTVNSYGRGFGSYSGTSYTPATFGVVGMVPVSNKQYTRFLRLDIYDLKSSRKDPKKVFEGTVKSEGSTGVFSAVSDCLIQALFQDFPGLNGKTTDITLSGDKCMATQ